MIHSYVKMMFLSGTAHYPKPERNPGIVWGGRSILRSVVSQYFVNFVLLELKVFDNSSEKHTDSMLVLHPHKNNQFFVVGSLVTNNK